MRETVMSIDSITVFADSFAVKSELKTSHLPLNNLTDQLSSHSGLFIKNYGPSSIATISYRGGNASQTMVNWNGIPISNPMLGLSDLSLINGSIIDHAYINTSAKSISGLTGSIDLTTSVNRKNQLTFTNSYGSFNNKEHSLKGEFSLGKISFSTNILTTSSTNNFPYTLTNGKREITQNSHTSKNALTFATNYAINKSHSLTYATWWQETSRQIPKLTTQSRSTAYQIDKSWRNSLQYSKFSDHSKLNAIVGLIKESILYVDPLILVDSPSDFTSIFTKSDFEYFYGKNKSTISLQNQFVNSTTKAYHNPAHYNLFRADLIHEFILDKTSWGVNIGATKSNTLSVKPLFKLFGIYQFTKYLDIDYSFGNAIRYPTTNDLYWSPGGNSNLRPEHSLNSELGLRFTKQHTKAGITFYNRSVTNWILWSLPIDKNYYSAQNLAKVKSYGVEYDASQNFSISSKWKGKIWTSGNIGRSINQIAIVNPIINEGDQLFYTPEIKSAIGIAAKYGKLSFDGSYQYISSTIGINGDLKPYGILNSSLAYLIIDKKRLNADLVLQAYNISNKQYRIIENRPMPGTNYKLSFILKLNK